MVVQGKSEAEAESASGFVTWVRWSEWTNQQAPYIMVLGRYRGLCPSFNPQVGEMSINSKICKINILLNIMFITLKPPEYCSPNFIVSGGLLTSFLGDPIHKLLNINFS